MKTNLFFLITLISISSFSQECPCVKTAIIGTGTKATFSHNNKVVAMDNVAIKAGETIQLFTKQHTGIISWYKNDIEVVNTLVSPTETTEYTVKSKINGCPDAISKVQIQVKKTSFEDLSNEVVFFPNPTNDLITISSNNIEIRKIRIDNIVGLNVKTLQFSNSTKKEIFNISDIPTGVYIMSIELEDRKIITKKLIKN